MSAVMATLFYCRPYCRWLSQRFIYVEPLSTGAISPPYPLDFFDAGHYLSDDDIIPIQCSLLGTGYDPLHHRDSLASHKSMTRLIRIARSIISRRLKSESSRKSLIAFG